MKVMKKVVILCLILIGALFLATTACSAYNKYENVGTYINSNIVAQLAHYNYYGGYSGYYYRTPQYTYGVYPLDKGYMMNEQRHEEEAYNNYLRGIHAERNRHIRWGY
ncbi:hypothetical protein KY325_01810 [Candidatus Woesearchaeota archaeon]|nr:hypothetical protein [Candidatus Woesearchaeota archaeon]MBW3017874.1 hypothetical protein [Candidatus Woesearchaeota archaeon]